MKKSANVKNGEGPSRGKKREKETKVSSAFLTCEVLGFLDIGLLVYLAFLKS